MSATTTALDHADIHIIDPHGLYDGASYSPHESLGYLIKITSKMLSNAIDQELAPYGLTHQQFSILMALSKLKCKTAADIARETCNDTGAITRMLDRLEAKGLIRRVRSVADRRIVNIELTATGMGCAEKMPIVSINVLNRVLDGFDKKELETMKVFLHRLLAANGVRIPGAADAANLRTAAIPDQA